jgi:large subunit ribosomal protein L10
MKKELKAQIIEQLTSKINEANHVYVTDIAELDAEATAALRRECFNSGLQIEVVKNTLLKNAFEKAEGDYSELYPILKGATSVIYSEHGNVPAKLIKKFRKGNDKPVLKGAYVEETVYIGDDQVDALTRIKSKNELIGDVITLLQSPAKNVISSLQSGGNTLTGLLKALSEKE